MYRELEREGEREKFANLTQSCAELSGVTFKG